MIIPKETQALERLKSTLLAEGYWQDVLEDVNIIENALNEYYRLLKEDDETTKKLKAYQEIIKKKRVNIEWLKACETYEEYLFVCPYGNEITETEFNLIKEWLEK